MEYNSFIPLTKRVTTSHNGGLSAINHKPKTMTKEKILEENLPQFGSAWLKDMHP